MVHSNFTELSHDAQGLLKGGFGSVPTQQIAYSGAQNNCACNSNNCDCPNSRCSGVHNNCECGGNNCNCTVTIDPTSPPTTGIPSGLLGM